MIRESAATDAKYRGERDLDPQLWFERHGDYLYCYARKRVRRGEVAEDLVQETLLAAWRGRAHFAGRASERSWLTAILKRKLIDHLRRKARDQIRFESSEGEPEEKRFSGSNKWKSPPKKWKNHTPDADGDADRFEFWEVLHGCLDKLPRRLRETFALRHLDEKPAEEICEAIDISPANLWVMLHRARAGLLKCLTKNWYGLDPESPMR